jgi:uncharacterized membrane protein YphA (DoxX/SURF4 family)
MLETKYRKITILVMVIRWVLAVSFIFYGVVKLLGGQFYHGDFVIDSRTTHGPELVWAFFGYSPIYGRLLGLAELIPGVMLLIPRAQFLGALLLFPVTLNITLMDFCFQFPSVKYLSLFFTVLCSCLLILDRDKFKLLTSESAQVSFKLPRLWILFFIPPLLFLSNLMGVAFSSSPVEAALARCEVAGIHKADLKLIRWQVYGWSGFDRRGFVEFETGPLEPKKIIRVPISRLYSLADWKASSCEIVDTAR